MFILTRFQAQVTGDSGEEEEEKKEFVDVCWYILYKI